MSQIPLLAPVRRGILWDFDPRRWAELAPLLVGLVSPRFARIEALGIRLPPDRIEAVEAAGGVVR